MKNVYYIGRDESCDIILQDDSNVISRTHAILRVGKGGKYTISDQSMNGTYVNGIRISSGVEVPISRTDNISFAHLVEFDWSLIPNTAKKTRVVVFSILGGLILIGALCWGSVKLFGNKQQPAPDEPVTPIEATSDSPKGNADSVKAATPPPAENRVIKKTAPEKPAAKVKIDKTVKAVDSESSKEESAEAVSDTVEKKKIINSII